jgi:hypothetical protein
MQSHGSWLEEKVTVKLSAAAGGFVVPGEVPGVGGIIPGSPPVKPGFADLPAEIP